MTDPNIVLAKIAHSAQSKSSRANAALILTTLALMLAATTVATAQTYTVLYNFDGTHGSEPTGILAQGRDGNLYGTTFSGGTDGTGVVFRITPSGRPKVLYYFDGADGSSPWAGLTLGTDGTLYGTTSYDGTNGRGTIFKITPSGSLITLYSCGLDCSSPGAPPIEAADGNFYGTASSTAYEITPSGSFASLGSLPGDSSAPLLQAKDGSFYGTALEGSSKCLPDSDCGTVFKMMPTGIVTIVYDFNGKDGRAPMAPVIQGSDGNFFGTTDRGGSNNAGVVFKLTPEGSSTVQHNFGDPNYPNDGENPYAGLVQATDGNFYGATTRGGITNNGVIFQITPAGVYSILHNFDGAHGAFPWSTPAQHTNGKLYGTSGGGGTSGDGVVYTFDMGLPPFVSLESTTDKVGTSIKILGQGFTGATAVSFNGVPATFKVWADTYLAATVPSGATTGPVTVTTPTGTLTSNHEFRVRPVILNVAPASGAAGTPVVIAGSSFTQTTKVTFGGGVATATFTVDSDTQITATVPAGAPTGYIVLTTTGGKSRSPGTFTVTP